MSGKQPGMQSQDRPMVIEMVGPAGAGKSTFTKVLLTQCPEIKSVIQPHYKSPQYWLFFISNFLQLLPLLIDLYKRGNRSWVSRYSIGVMIILNGWHRLLLRNYDPNTRALFMDQGPVSTLAYLYRFEKGAFSSPKAQKWWEDMIQVWSKTLNLLILLDAPNEILYQRIVSRDQEHSLQTETFDQASMVLNQYRLIYQDLFADFQKRSNFVHTLKFQYAVETQETLHQNIIASIDQELKDLSFQLSK